MSSDFRPDAQTVVFDGHSSTKTPKPPTDFIKQTPRPSATKASVCAVDSYDTDYDDGRGGIVEGLRSKNDRLSPRTKNAEFAKMGSHNDHTSFSNLAQRTKQHDAEHGVGLEELTVGLAQTRPKTIRNIDFGNLAPRKETDRSYPTFTESCANPDNIYPKHILEQNVGGNPFLTKHIDRDTRSKATAPAVARVTDNFYDYSGSYNGTLSQAPKNAVNISKSSGRDAYGMMSDGGGLVGSPRSRESKALDSTAHLGPGTYDPKYTHLSKPSLSQK